MSTAVSLGKRWEISIKDRLEMQGYKVVHTPYNSPYDLLVDGRVRIEVKCSSKKKTRHGDDAWIFMTSDWNRFDLWVFILLDYETDGSELILMCPEPQIHGPNLSISRRSILLRRWKESEQRWKEFLASGEKTKSARLGAGQDDQPGESRIVQA